MRITGKDRDQHACHYRSERGVTKPQQGSGCDDLADCWLLIIWNQGHRWNLHHIEIPQQTEPHHPTKNVKPSQGKQEPLWGTERALVGKHEQNSCQQGKSSQDGATKGGEDAYHAMCPCFCDLIFLNTETGLNPSGSRCNFQFTILGVAFFAKNYIKYPIFYRIITKIWQNILHCNEFILPFENRFLGPYYDRTHPMPQPPSCHPPLPLY